MKRVLGAVLVGVGLFAAVLAILLPTVVVPASKKIPLDLDLTTVATGPGKVLDTATNTVKDVRLQATRIARSDSQHSNGKATTVHESLCIMVASGATPGCVGGNDPRRLQLTTDTVTVLRKNGQATHVDGWGENVNGDTSVRHDGLAYAFPIDTAKRTYQFFQPDVHKSFPAVFSGTDTIDGLKVYKFVARTGDVTQVDGKPYLVQGLAPGTYNDTRTVWVEPRTGVIVKGVEAQTVTLKGSSVPALQTTLTFDSKTIHDQAKYAKDKIRSLTLAGVWGPVVLGIVAIAALVGAYLLLFRRPAEPRRHSEATTPPNEPVNV